MGIFKVSLHSWQRVLILLSYEDPPPPQYCLPHTPFSNFVHTSPTPTSLSAPPPAPTVFSVVMFLWLNGTLVPERPWCVFHETRHQVYQSLTLNVVFTGTLIWYQSHTAHSGASRLTHPYRYIFTPPLMCS